MYKETIICIIVVALILIGNTVTGNYTKDTIETISSSLSQLRSEINQETISSEKANEKVDYIDKQWEDRYDTLAYYIEHNELEKFKLQLTSLNAYIEEEKYSDAVNELDKSINILKNIEEKNKFSLKNIF